MKNSISPESDGGARTSSAYVPGATPPGAPAAYAAATWSLPAAEEWFVVERQAGLAVGLCGDDLDIDDLDMEDRRGV